MPLLQMSFGHLSYLTLAILSSLTLTLAVQENPPHNSIHKPKCTLPPPSTNFVSGPNVRGTLSILWDFLSIILLCTWSIQHLNVPAVDFKGPKAGIWMNPRRPVLAKRRQVKWMFWTTMAPEVLVGKAFDDWMAMKYGHGIWKGHGWKKINVRLANIGYYVLHFESQNLLAKGHDLGVTDPNPHSLVQSDSKFAVRVPSQRSAEEVHNLPDGERIANSSGSNFTIPLTHKQHRESTVVSGTIPGTGGGRVGSMEQSDQGENNLHVSVHSQRMEADMEADMEANNESPPFVSSVSQATEINDGSEDAGRAENENGLGSVSANLWEFENFPPKRKVAISKLLLSRWSRLKMGWLTKISEEAKLERLHMHYWTLTACQWKLVCDEGIAEVPITETRDLESLDRGGIIVKVLALLQVAHLIVQLVARWEAHLPSSQLEITALAFSMSSIITMGLFWNKPQGVGSVQIVQAIGQPTREEVKEILKLGPDRWWGTDHQPDDEYKFYPIPNDSIQYPSQEHHEQDLGAIKRFVLHHERYLGIMIGGVLFGCVHLIAWNFHFHTPVEAILWRISALLTIVLPFAFFVIDDRQMLLLVFFFYLLARLFLIVEGFRTLFELPPGAFVETWAGSFPYFG